MKKLFLISSLILIFSCKKENQIEVQNTTIIDTLATSSFDYKYKNEPKYFLKFWKGMTKEEYEKTKIALRKEGKIGLYNDISIGDSKIDFEPIIENEIVIGIELPSVDENIYNLYVKKYNLPKLEIVSLIGECYKESNPCFMKDNCKDDLNYDPRRKEVKLNEVLLNTNLGDNLYLYDKKTLKERNHRVSSIKTNILVRRELLGGFSGLGNLMYSGKYDITDTDFYYPDENSLPFKNLNYELSKSAKHRYVVMHNKSQINIIYYPSNYFKDEERLQQVKQNKKEIEKIEIAKKEKEILNNI